MLLLVLLKPSEVLLVHQDQCLTQLRSLLNWSGKDDSALMHYDAGAFANTITDRDVEEVGQESDPLCLSISSSSEEPS